MPQENSQIVFRYGTQSQYNNLTTKDINTIYIVTDTHKIYIGDSLYSGDGGGNNSITNNELLQIRVLLQAYQQGELSKGSTDVRTILEGITQEIIPETGQYEEETE